MSFTITTPGIFVDFDVEAYHQDPCIRPSLNQSTAKILIERSPAHAFAQHPRLAGKAADEPEEAERYNAAQAIGNAAHALLIGRGKAIAPADFPTWQSKDAKAFKADAIAAGKTPILEKHMLRAVAMVAACREQLHTCGWADAFAAGEGHGEVVIAWEEGGIWFRSLLDWLPTATANAYDLKSTALSVAPHAIPNLMASAGWHIQAAFHRRGLNILDPERAGRYRFRFVAIENEPPFAMTPVEMTEAALTMGDKQIEYAIREWRRALEADRWPSYSANVCRPEFPGWKETAWLNREVEESERGRGGMIPSLMGG